MRTAIVLFNLGGPDRPEAIRPFLFNLFNDPAIIGAPGPIRWLLAKRISAKRVPVAREIYAQLGGSSPLLANTLEQARALEFALGDLGEVRAFVAMRYWHPMSDETVREVIEYAPDRVLLLPLYPQFSTTTTGSSIADWYRAARSGGLTVPAVATCCYPREEGFVEAMASAITDAIERLRNKGHAIRVLFSAHGLPKRIVERGDPYQWQVEQGAAAVATRIGIAELDWTVCYQSRVGPLEWIGPDTEAEIERAGRDGKAVVLAPIAFVSEHSETLVELDIEYRELAERAGVTDYERVSTVGTDPRFIAGLAAVARQTLHGQKSITRGDLGEDCPAACSKCALRI